jgi:hypothetical protein
MPNLTKLDRRWVFLFMGLCVLIPLLKPVPLKIIPGNPATKFYEAIEKVPEGSRILVSGDYDPASKPELQPMMLTLLDQAFRRNLKVVCMELWPQGPSLVQQALDAKAAQYHKVAGVDYVNLGFKEGQQVVMVSLGTRGFAEVYPVDIDGKPVGEIPIMKGVRDYTSFALIANISAGFPGTKEWVQQVVTRFHIPLGSGCTAVSAAEYYVYFGSGQVFGLLGGMAGAAEYEQLAQRPAMGTAGMGAMSFGHFVIIFFILFGNVLGFVSSRKGAR